jgi:hypothetical protein
VRVGLSGTLSTIPLSDLLQWLGSASKTGTLRVRGERYTRTVYLKDGRIVSSGSDDPTEQLGQFLLSHGRISEEDLRMGLETQARTRVLLGRILLMTGKIEEDELKRLLTQKAEETIFGLFLWTDAHFEFEDGELPGSLFVPIGLDVHDVLMKGVTIVDELRHIRREFGSTASVPQRSEKKLPQGFPPERSMERAVLSMVDGRRTVAEICLAVHASEFTVGKMLLQFLDMGYINLARRVEPAAPRRAPEPDRPFLSHDTLVQRARERLDAGDPEQALDLLRQALAASPRDYRIKKMFDEAGAAFREEAYARWLPPSGVPRMVKDLASLTSEPLGPEEMFLLSRIDGSWDVKSIIDISPLGEVEALRQMKRLLDRGLIDIG